jgi:membrane protease YdiL (CAAX protease family)
LNVIDYDLTTSNIISDLFFDFVITGLSEEILFRGLIMGLLLKAWQGFLGTGRPGISLAGIFAAVLFSPAYIGIDWQALEIAYFNPLQLVFSMRLGLFYAFMMDKSNSLLGPVIAHGASDGLITVINLMLLKF